MNAEQWFKTLCLEDRIACMSGGMRALAMAFNAGVAAKNSEVVDIAVEIADSVARSDIEVECLTVELDGERYYDTSLPDPEDAAWVGRATRYLQLRGHLIRHPDMPHLVRWESSNAVEQE